MPKRKQSQISDDNGSVLLATRTGKAAKTKINSEITVATRTGTAAKINPKIKVATRTIKVAKINSEIKVATRTVKAAKINPKIKVAAKKTTAKRSKAIIEEKPGVPENGKRIVMAIPSLVTATVVNRPSKVIKSPYMADIMLQGEKESQLCHSPALGCAGLIVPGCQVLVTPKPNSTGKSKYSLDLIDIGSSLVGANPNFCNKMVRVALEAGWVHSLPQFTPKQIKSEVTIDESRFDFRCEQDGIVYYIEVKGVPNAHHVDPPAAKKRGKKVLDEEDDKEKIQNTNSSLIAFFPDGYRKSPADPISPRALKHVEHLTRLSTEKNTLCVLLFVVQRSDCHIFQPTKNDPIYRSAVYRASQAGVRILAHSVRWDRTSAEWREAMPVNLHDHTDPVE